jgi:hypothetical protein
MLESLRGKGSERKQRLFICACCRHLRTARAQHDRAVIEVAERCADGEVGGRDLAKARRVHSNSRRDYYGRDNIEFAVSAAVSAGPGLPAGAVALSLLEAAYWTGPAGYDRANIEARYAAREAERARQATTVRCVFGNPFHPVEVEPGWRAWHGGAVVNLATAVYEERELPSGHLDAARLAVLADMLEEAGCSDAQLLDHLRGPGPHVRGCFAVDALLGKS